MSIQSKKKKTTLIIIGHHQTTNLPLQIAAINKLKVKPDQIIYAADRATPGELAIINWTGWEVVDVNDELISKAIIIRENNGFFAPYVRNIALEHAIGDYIIFLDGDMVPQGEIVSAYKKVLRYNKVAIGRRLDYQNLQVDVRELPEYDKVFSMKKVDDKKAYDMFRVLWSCNFGFTRDFYNTVREFNQKCYLRNEFFNSYFNGSYGGEDTALGYLAYKMNYFVAPIHDHNGDCLHIAHPRPNNKYNANVHVEFTKKFLNSIDVKFKKGIWEK